MAITTYQELQDAIAQASSPKESWSRRSDISATRVQDFIRFAELRSIRGSQIQEGLRAQEVEKQADVTLSAEFVNVPSDFVQAKRFYIDSSPRQVLKYVPPALIDERYPTTESGTPRFFSVEAQQFKFKPVPSTSATGKLLYWFQPTVLSAGNTTNELLDNFPDMLLYGALAELWNYLKDPAKESQYRQLWADAVSSANANADRNEESGSSIEPQGYSNTP